MELKADEDDEYEVDDKEGAMLVRKFKKASNKIWSHRRNLNRKFSSSRKELGYHKCSCMEHIIRDCPQWDIKKGKVKGKEHNKEMYYKPSYSENDLKKAMIAAYGDSDSEGDEEQPEEEITNLCLISKTDQDNFLEKLDSKVFIIPIDLKYLS